MVAQFLHKKITTTRFFELVFMMEINFYSKKVKNNLKEKKFKIVHKKGSDKFFV